MRRAVLEAAEILKKQGHNVFEVKIPKFNELVMSVLAIMTSEGKNRGMEEGL